MATNPSLLVQPPQQQDLLGQLGKVMALKNMLQEQAYRQQQMQYQQQMQPLQLQQQQAATEEAQQNALDMKLSTQALQQSNGNPEDYLKKLREGGVSFKAYSTVQNSLLDYQIKQENKSKLQLDNEKDTADRVESQFQVAKDKLQTNPQLAAGAYDRGLTMAEQGGLIQPGQINHQLPSSTDAIDTAMNLLGFHKAITENASKQAQIPGEVARSQMDVAKNAAYQNWRRIPGNEFKSIDDFNTEQAVAEEVAKTKAVQPYKIAQVQAEAAVHAAFQNAYFDRRDMATKIETQALPPYNKIMDKVAAAKDALRLAQQQGNTVAARAAMADLAGVTVAGGGKLSSKDYDKQFGSLPVQWAGKLKGIFTGDDMTEGVAKDALAYVDSVGDTATKNANRSIQQIHDIHDPSHTKPVTQLPDYVYETQPQGANGRVLRNGRWYWANGQTKQIIGAAPPPPPQ